MWEILRTGRVGALGCEELGRLRLMDTSVCCEVCHSVERHVPVSPWGRAARRCRAGERL